jgi:hypothetical protein
MRNISSIPSSSSNNITDPQYLEAKWRGWAEREAEKRTPPRFHGRTGQGQGGWGPGWRRRCQQQQRRQQQQKQAASRASTSVPSFR